MRELRLVPAAAVAWAATLAVLLGHPWLVAGLVVVVSWSFLRAGHRGQAVLCAASAALFATLAAVRSQRAERFHLSLIHI